MKTITLTVSDDATITVDGKEYVPKELDAPTKPERVLWTPKDGETYVMLWSGGNTSSEKWSGAAINCDHLNAGSIFPTREHAEAAKRHREAQSVIDRYCYAKGIDTRRKGGVEQWCVWQNHDNVLESYFTINAYGSPFYVESKAIAEQIIADCADAIRTVLLRGWNND